jgi:hypothetical protein
VLTPFHKITLISSFDFFVLAVSVVNSNRGYVLNKTTRKRTKLCSLTRAESQFVGLPSLFFVRDESSSFDRIWKCDMKHRVSRITYHVSRITYHVSRITHHASRTTSRLSFRHSFQRSKVNLLDYS